MSYLERATSGQFISGMAGLTRVARLGRGIVCKMILTSLPRHHGLGEAEALVEGFRLEKIGDREKSFFLD